MEYRYGGAPVFCSLDLVVGDTRFVPNNSGSTIHTLDGRFGGLCFRFSAFDRMVTVVGASFPLFAETLPKATAFLTENKFNYIPLEELSDIYDPAFPREKWFHRFFDY